MKYRSDFVTNSSSSSFIIRKRNLTDNQIKAIFNHVELGEKLGMSYTNDAWDIYQDDDFIKGFTIIDNFDMENFLDRIDVRSRFVFWNVDTIDDEDYKENETEKISWEDLLDEI